jgi:hypothetical protein
MKRLISLIKKNYTRLENLDNDLCVQERLDYARYDRSEKLVPS